MQTSKCLKKIWHFQCSVDTKNRVKMKTNIEKSVLVLDIISTQIVLVLFDMLDFILQISDF